MPIKPYVTAPFLDQLQPGQPGYDNLQTVLVQQASEKLFGNTPEEYAQNYKEWFDQSYGATSPEGYKHRVFHGQDHVITEMLRSGSHWEGDQFQQLKQAIGRAYGEEITLDEFVKLEKYRALAAPGHDQEYHTDGSLSKAADNLEPLGFPKNIATGMANITIPAFDANDKVAHVVLDLFGKKSGEPINPFAGENEFLSALSWAKRLEDKGESLETIAGVTAIIAATVPFKKPEDFEKLRDRIKGVFEKEEYRDSLPRYEGKALDRQVDMFMGTATTFANKDVLGFVGGTKRAQEVLADHSLKPEFEDVLQNYVSGNKLTIEEGAKSVKMATIEGEGYGHGYTAADLLKSNFSRVRLTNLILAGNFKERIQNGTQKIFHNFKLSNGEAFPPQADIDRLNGYAMSPDNAYEGNNDICRLAHAAQVASFAIIHAAQNALPENEPLKHADLASLTHNISERSLRLSGHDLPRDEKPEEKRARDLAHDVLLDTSDKLTSDLIPSTFAAALVAKVPAGNIIELYNKAEKAYGKEPNTELQAQFLDDAAKLIGRENLNKILNGMVQSLQGVGEHGVAADLRSGHTQTQVG